MDEDEIQTRLAYVGRVCVLAYSAPWPSRRKLSAVCTS